ncbi:hypothetical protein [Prochlorococcus sp. MIT 1201]|uniref:hypothetical protein n=1 Tax=Prochlorococcus sp. MIT 1201 TaxID=3082535 RepID=UPI0039A4D9B8
MSEIVLELNNQIEIGEQAWKITPKQLRKNAKGLANKYDLKMDSWEIGRSIAFVGRILMELDCEVTSSKDNISGICDLNDKDREHLFTEKMDALVDVINYKNMAVHMYNIIILTCALAYKQLKLDNF